MSHFNLGAINKNTLDYEIPLLAKKENKYKCPSCEKDVIFKKGLVKIPHFAHKHTQSCYYYDKPSESEIHKSAKLLIKNLLENRIAMEFYRICKDCHIKKQILLTNSYPENCNVFIEYRFYYNEKQKIADIAVVNTDISYIIEIYYKHKTIEEQRPEPWIELDANNLIHNLQLNNYDINKCIEINCIRNYQCEKCIEKEEKQILEMIKRQKEHEEQQRQQKIKEENEYEEQQLQKKIKQEQAFINYLKQQELIKKQNEMRQLCKCGLMFGNICDCMEPKFEFQKLSKNYFCIKCNKWKCRC